MSENSNSVSIHHSNSRSFAAKMYQNAVLKNFENSSENYGPGTSQKTFALLLFSDEFREIF